MYLLAHLASIALLPIGIAYLMMWAGVQKGALEWKRRARTCPSCGREDYRCSCH